MRLDEYGSSEDAERRMMLTHDVGLGPDGHEPVDVLADGDEHLAGHVAALLGSWHLVLNMDTGRSLLDEELRELHHSGQTTMTSVCIGNDWAEEVDVGEF